MELARRTRYSTLRRPPLFNYGGGARNEVFLGSSCKHRTICRETTPGRELLGTQRQQTKSKGQKAEKREVQGGGASVTYVRVLKKGS